MYRLQLDLSVLNENLIADCLRYSKRQNFLGAIKYSMVIREGGFFSHKLSYVSSIILEKYKRLVCTEMLSRIN